MFFPSTNSPIHTGDVALVDSEHAQISDILWDILGLQETDAALAISPTGPSIGPLSSFICWASRSPNVGQGIND
jgi:hypothetical protein